MGWTECWVIFQSVRLLYGVWPLAASMEVKNNHAHVTTPIILYKFIEVNFSVGCTVWLWCCQFQDLTTISLKSVLIEVFSGSSVQCHMTMRWKLQWKKESLGVRSLCFHTTAPYKLGRKPNLQYPEIWQDFLQWFF